MPRLSQNKSGDAWEYGLAKQFSELLRRPLRIKNGGAKTKDAYESLTTDQRRRIDEGANESVLFLRAFDERFDDVVDISIQADSAGIQGDVRDILLHFEHGDPIGISAKHRNSAVKHSRLSSTIDFGELWYDRPCSDNYWRQVRPLFSNLEERGGRWQDIDDKHTRYYLPILRAFVDEVRTYAVASTMLSYLIGRQDFYKVVKVNGYISIQSFNLNGTLKWGTQLPMPDRILEFLLKSKSNTTALLAMNNGWQLSFRIHNARSMVEPSLKFDIQLIGHPAALATNMIRYRI